MSSAYNYLTKKFIEHQVSIGVRQSEAIRKLIKDQNMNLDAVPVNNKKTQQQIKYKLVFNYTDLKKNKNGIYERVKATANKIHDTGWIAPHITHMLYGSWPEIFTFVQNPAKGVEVKRTIIMSEVLSMELHITSSSGVNNKIVFANPNLRVVTKVESKSRRETMRATGKMERDPNSKTTLKKVNKRR